MQQRARKIGDKQERRQAILTAAWTAFLATSYESVTMAGVASQVGLAKGTLYLYFRTKEELFLALVMEQLAAWFDAVDAALPQIGSGHVDDVAQLIGDSLRARHGLTRLLAILSTVLEQNVSVDAALHFKQMLLLHLGQTGQRLETCLPRLEPGDGAHVLLRIHALIVGLQHLADPAPVVRHVMEQPGMQVFQIDFERELAECVQALLHGLYWKTEAEQHEVSGDGRDRIRGWKGGAPTARQWG